MRKIETSLRLSWFGVYRAPKNTVVCAVAGHPHLLVPDQASSVVSLYIGLKFTNSSSVGPRPGNTIPGRRGTKKSLLADYCEA